MAMFVATTAVDFPGELRGQLGHIFQDMMHTGAAPAPQPSPSPPPFPQLRLMAVVAAVGVRLRFPNIELADTPSDLERTLRTAFATLMDLDVSVDDTTLISVLPGSVVVQVGAEGRLDLHFII